MDTKQFDDFARGLAGMRSRRGVLKAIGGALLGAVAGGARLDGANAGPPPKKCKYQGSNCSANTDCCTLNCCNRVCCGDGQVCCNGQCRAACPSGQTLNAACQCVSTAPACSSASQCPQPTAQCQVAICVNGQCGTMSAANGAACNDGNACTLGDYCSNGACVPGTAVNCGASDQCHAPGTCNSQTGACSYQDLPDGTTCNDGNLCTVNDHCVAGVCTSTPVTCGPPSACQVSVACDPSTGACVAVNKQDGTSCGAGTACASDICQAGQCVRTPKAAGTSCSDNNSCTSGDACDGQGACVSGAPVTCPPPDACHTGACDPANGCVYTLTSGSCFIGGACYKAGDLAQGNSCKVCDPTRSTIAFSYVQDGVGCDDGNKCTVGDTCQGGACVAGAAVTCTALDQCHVAGACDPATGICTNPNIQDGATCDDGNACTTGDRCVSGNCKPTGAITCAANETCDPNTGICGCAPGFTACPNGCVDATSDASNCGGCGLVCPTGATCGNSVCACPTGLIVCGGACVDPSKDVSNCGGCGKACLTPNATPICVAGACEIAICNAGFEDCDGNPANGCETKVFSDPNNCGVCGNVCNLPNATAACLNGACAIATCNAGFGDCDGKAANGCETKTDSDPNNCGACGHVCDSTNGTATCSGGACGIICNAGFANCDNDPAIGCETGLDTVINCGTCGNVCPGYQQPFDNVTCQNEACTFSCQGEHYDVNGNPSDGCEVADTDQGNHTQGTALVINGTSNCDSFGPYVVAGKLPSDKRVHENPSITGFDATTGSAPDWYVTTPNTSNFTCTNDVNFTLQMNGSSSPACYKLTVMTGLNTYSAQTDGTGLAEIHHDTGQYTDGNSVYFEVSKICGTNVVEAPTYSVSFTL